MTEIITLSGSKLFAWDGHDIILGCLCSRLTFIQPVRKAIKHNSLFTSGNQADRSALYCCSVVHVVFKYEDLDREMQNREPLLLSVSLYVDNNCYMYYWRAPKYKFSANLGLLFLSLCISYPYIHTAPSILWPLTTTWFTPPHWGECWGCTTAQRNLSQMSVWHKRWRVIMTYIDFVTFIWITFLTWVL